MANIKAYYGLKKSSNAYCALINKKVYEGSRFSVLCMASKDIELSPVKLGKYLKPLRGSFDGCMTTNVKDNVIFTEFAEDVNKLNYVLIKDV